MCYNTVITWYQRGCNCTVSVLSQDHSEQLWFPLQVHVHIHVTVHVYFKYKHSDKYMYVYIYTGTDAQRTTKHLVGCNEELDLIYTHLNLTKRCQGLQESSVLCLHVHVCTVAGQS